MIYTSPMIPWLISHLLYSPVLVLSYRGHC